MKYKHCECAVPHFDRWMGTVCSICDGVISVKGLFSESDGCVSGMPDEVVSQV